MDQHIIPQDNYNHIEDITCGCSPSCNTIEGDTIYIHNEIPDRIPLLDKETLSNYFKEIDNETENT